MSEQTRPNLSAELRRHRFSDVLNRRRPGAEASRLVGLMKLLLPAIALAVAGLTAAWPQLLPDKSQLEQVDSALTGLQVGGLTIENPRYIGTDESHRPYQISAASASQRDTSDKLIYLAEPAADLHLSDDGWVALTANAGIYNRSVETMALTGNVTLLYHAGYSFYSDTVDIDLREATAEGRQPVRGIGPGGEITAEGFRLTSDGKRVTFTGRSRAVLSHPSEKTR